MLSTETNERLTRVGPGTEMGELLRRYWLPVSDLRGAGRRERARGAGAGRVAGAVSGSADRLGLVDQRCPHRGASLAMGIPSDGCLECPYHGWTFDSAGGCVRQPAESADSTFHTRSASSPTRSASWRLIWAYMGPGEPPLLPRYGPSSSDPASGAGSGVSDIPCNFLQVMENSFDPVHREYSTAATRTTSSSDRAGRRRPPFVRRTSDIAPRALSHAESEWKRLTGSSRRWPGSARGRTNRRCSSRESEQNVDGSRS